MIQRVKCLFGKHQEYILGIEQPFKQKMLLKCNHCGKYGFWNVGVGFEYWTSNVDKLPKEIKEHIEKYNL